MRGFSGFALGAALGSCPPLPPGRWLPLLASAALAGAILSLHPAATALAAAGLVMALGAPGTRLRPVEGLLASPALVWLGHVSFSIYLLHVPLMMQVGQLPLVRALMAGPAGKWAGVAVLLLLLLPLAAATHRLIEQPARRWAARSLVRQAA